MTPEEDAKQEDQPRQEGVRPRLFLRATIRKFWGDDQTGEPFETIVSKDDGFDEALARKERESNATD